MSAHERRHTPWALQFSVAALFSGTAASALAVAPPGNAETPIGALHRQHSVIAARYDAMDEALLELPAGPWHNAMKEAFHQAFDDCLALQARMLALQAQTLEDAAIQVTICYYFTESMDQYATEAEVSELRRQMRTAPTSVMLAVSKVGGMDIDRFGWGDMRRLCSAHSPAGRARA